MNDTNMSWWDCHKPTKRRLIQLYSALLYNANLKGFVNGRIYTGKTKALCVPGFNCYSCPGAVGACPLGSLQASVAAAGKHIGFYIIGIILLYGLIAGRTICGWFCPLGLLQELLNKIPTPKIRKSRVTRGLSYLKYVMLAVFAFLIPLWYGLKHSMAVSGFCKYICPAGTFEGAMALLSNKNNSGFFGMLGVLFTRKFVIMLFIGLACVFCYRSFCRFLCPLGALYGMFCKLAVIGVKVDTGRCNGCGLCVSKCKMDVKRVGDHECIHCGHCIDTCAQGALSLKVGEFTLKAPLKGCADDTEQSAEKRKKVEKYGWTIAVIVLVFSLLWYNVLSDRGEKKEATADKASGAQIEAESAREVLGTEESSEVLGAKEAEEASDAFETGEVSGTKEAEEAKGAFETEEVLGIKEATEAPEASGTENSTEAAGMSEVYEASETEAGEVQDEVAGADMYLSDAPVGNKVGDRLEDFSAKCLNGTDFSLSDQRGKVVIINLWATWCGPCVEELPYFDEFYAAHKDDVAILACHSPFVTDDVEEFLKEKGWEIPFTIDEDGEGVFRITGGSNTLPQTIVLNKKGEVTYNEIRSVTPEMLNKLYEQAAED